MVSSGSGFRHKHLVVSARLKNEWHALCIVLRLVLQGGIAWSHV